MSRRVGTIQHFSVAVNSDMTVHLPQNLQSNLMYTLRFYVKFRCNPSTFCQKIKINAFRRSLHFSLLCQTLFKEWYPNMKYVLAKVLSLMNEVYICKV